MTDLEFTPDTAKGGMDRRTVLKAAAWSAPVIALAAATPLASASVGNASLAWTGGTTTVATLNLLTGGTVNVAAGVLVARPVQFTLTNGPGAINQSATITIVVSRPEGLNITVGRGRGFGVYQFDGANVGGSNTVTYLPSNLGLPTTTYTTTRTLNVASNGALTIPVVFGLSGSRAGLSINVLATFPVNLTVDFGGGDIYTASSSITVPVGAGIL